MATDDVVGQLSSGLAEKRVFGEPYEQGDLTIIPVSAIRGGGGFGRSSGKGEANPEAGGGFGVVARPVGAYVVKGGDVRWEPALDLNRVIVGGQLVAVALFLVMRSVLRHRRH